MAAVAAAAAFKQPGRAFFLSNSLAVYTQNTVAARSTRFFVHNTWALSNSAKQKTKKTLSFNTATVAASPFYLAASPRLAAGKKATQQVQALWSTLPKAGPGPGPVLTTLKAVFFPMLKRDPLSTSTLTKLGPLRKGFATHRDTGHRYGGGGSSGSSGSSSGSSGSGKSKWGRIFSYLKVPLTVTAGVLLFNGIALPYVLQIPGLNVLNQRPDLVVYTLMGLNLAVFLAWKSPRAFGRQLYRYGLLHKDAQFNKWSMLGSAFSHQEFWHLGVNMFVLYQFGLPLAKWVGGAGFLEMYLDGAVLSSLGSIAVPVLLNAFTPWVAVANVPSLGASGAIFTVFGAFAYLVPYARLSLFFVPLPIGAWYVFLLTMGYNGLGLFYRFGMSDYAGHFAGSMAGIWWGWVFAERAKKNRERTPRVRRF